MKTQSKIILATAGLTALLAGCSTADLDDIKQGYSLNHTTHTYPAVSPNKVKLVYKNNPNATKLIPCKDYETISMISIEPFNTASLPKSESTIDNSFKEAGGSVGADAVINITDSEGMGSNAEGYAIKCK